MNKSKLQRALSYPVLMTVSGMVLSACVSASTPEHASNNADQSEISIVDFDDAVNHWKNINGKDYPRYSPDQVYEIAENILLLQRDHGGWIQNRDPMRILSDEEKATIVAEKSDPRGSFDNRNVYPQITYLMGAYERLGDARYKDAAQRGLTYLLDNQIETCGGWPHTVPPSESYHPMLTIADEVTSGPTNLLRQIAQEEWPFERMDTLFKERARAGLDRAEACLLTLQIRQDGVPTAWAGQYDPQTLKPVMGRTFELTSIATQESVLVLRYLMSIEEPSAEIIASIEGGISWLKKVQLRGYRLVEVPLEEPVQFRYHSADYDRQLIEDETAAPLWARFYDINDNSVILANRDSQRVARFEDVHMERRTGYHWYGNWGVSLIQEDYPAWKERVYKD